MTDVYKDSKNVSFLSTSGHLQATVKHKVKITITSPTEIILVVKKGFTKSHRLFLPAIMPWLFFPSLAGPLRDIAVCLSTTRHIFLLP